MSGNSLVAGSGEVFFGADMTLGIGDGGGGSNVFDLGNFGIFDGVSQIRIDSLTELTITRDSIAAVTGDSVDKLYVQGSSNHTIRLADDPDSFDPFDPVSGTAGWSRDTAQDEVVGGISYQAYVNDTNNDVLMVAAGVNVTQ